MIEQTLKSARVQMEKAMKAFENEISRLRTGRASLSLLDEVRIEYYGQMVPLNQVATLGVPEARLITISPWESKLTPEIEKAINKANLGVKAVNDGKLIRMPIPPLTEERRRELVKMVKHYGEETKIAMRHARREGLDQIKKLEKEGQVTEDESKKISEQTQKLTDEYTSKVDRAMQNKEEEIMKV